MPARMKSVCRAPACGKLLDTPGFCDKHKKAARKEQDDRRGTAAERGYDSRWTKARAYYLRKHPLCVYCQREGRISAANVVDHKINHKLKDAIDSSDAGRIAQARALFWSSDNWQSLCKPCHDSTKQTEDRGKKRLVVGSDEWVVA
jgi:5-methylcytosine-specific restriction protein A